MANLFTLSFAEKTLLRRIDLLILRMALANSLFPKDTTI